MKSKTYNLVKGLGLSLVASAMLAGTANAQPGYVTGDFHQHSTFSDGSYSLSYVMDKNAEFGLDWWANSEHGGYRDRDGRFSGNDLDTTVYWYLEEGIEILGDVKISGGHQYMWRWQSLRDYSFPTILEARERLPKNVIIQGFEWNVPGHEHGSVGIITGQFCKNANANALAEFEYKFDNSDSDKSGGAGMGWVKSEKSRHEKTVEAIEWLQANHQFTSWMVPAHPERARSYDINHFRDMNNAGPDVCFGFESMPGHQKSSSRGGYGTGADGSGVFGGCGVYAAKVGGLWDAMLSEGRGWWLFASSDFHSTGGDFWPGEYQKTYTWVRDRKNPYAIVDGLRSGNSWIVEGDLIDGLNFKVYDKKNRSQHGAHKNHKRFDKYAEMGQTLDFSGDEVYVSIVINDPETTNNFGNNPVLDHVDLIMGKVSGLISPDSAEYYIDTVATTKVIARFDAEGGIVDASGLTSIAWEKLGESGKILIKYKVENVEDACYFRLRGTNAVMGDLTQLDEYGNPAYELPGTNTYEEVTTDLWFYSNPIFAAPVKGKCNGKKMKSADEVFESSVADLSNATLYPNPTNSDVVYINNFDVTETPVSVQIFNVSGQLVSTANLTANEINVENLRAGTYIILVKTENQAKTLQLIKK